MTFVLIAGNAASASSKSSVMIDSNKFAAKLYDEGVLFYATGNEPFWSFRINRDSTMIFDMLGKDELRFPGYMLNRAMDANVFRVDSKTESAAISAQIIGQKCTDNMSGNESPYSVEVTITIGYDSPVSYSGCGMYIPDFRLSGKWQLSMIGGDKIDAAVYGEKIPYLEFDMQELRVSGIAGCNRISGPVRNEGDMLSLSRLISTLMACPENLRESDVLKGLNSATNYSIIENELILSNPDGELLSYTRILPDSENQTIGEKIYKLNDIWVIESIEGRNVANDEFIKGIPYLEFHIKDMKYMGHTGCNNISGKFEASDETISVEQGIMTRMTCPGDFEQRYVSALSSADRWKVENLRLYLYLGDKELLVFRKTD